MLEEEKAKKGEEAANVRRGRMAGAERIEVCHRVCPPKGAISNSVGKLPERQSLYCFETTFGDEKSPFHGAK